MHELSLAHSIGEIAVRTLREEMQTEELRREESRPADEADGVSLRVGKVRVRVGDLSGVDPEALAFCFEVVRGEWVETAEAVLEIQRRPARVRCLECGRESDLTLDAPSEDGLCEGCGASRREVVGGRELEVFGVELTGRAA